MPKKWRTRRRKVWKQGCSLEVAHDAQEMAHGNERKVSSRVSAHDARKLAHGAPKWINQRLPRPMAHDAQIGGA
ncbi:hypothetical protein L195_g029652 [Trifolium pratense]|uniref:Uncharacterized protein n=1 Tax=Trifolium pratense TaxID=57577 RepID=A0A2K3L5E4_TRIPR|nr:hypothetical protein L195_g029652 [Trifolium pratense]